MSDLERRVRDALEQEARSAPLPHEPRPSLRRTRRRQALTLASGALAAIAVVAAAVLGVRAAVTTNERTPAGLPTTTTTINGISITHPDGWYVFDPDDEGLNGPTDGPANARPGLPRLVLAVYPRDLDELFACPGMAEGDPPTFVMTIQEQPLALAGEATAPWPVEPRPLSIEGLAESACYPGWELLGNDWTAAGRSYQARVGFAPEASDQDRRSLLDAFASMTFEAAPEPAASVVLATGTAGGEEWDLIAERQTDGLSLSLDAETFGAGIGGFDPATPELQFSIHTFGVGDSAETVLFGAVPIEAVRIGARVTVDDEAMVDVLDVPDSIDPAMNAFVVAVTGSPVVTISAYDASGRVVVSATVDAAAGTPVEAPPWRSEVEPEHGGTYWGVYLAVAASLDDPKIREWTEQAERLAYTPSVGDLACDQGAAAALGVAEGSSRVAIYFATREDAEAAYADVVTRYREPFGIARVTTYCLD